jgi:hypothetical protein
LHPRVEHARSQGLTLPGSSDPCLICSSNMAVLARALHVSTTAH